MKASIKTKEDFLKIELNQVSKIYVGKDNDCRCGCAGTYCSTTYSQVELDIENANNSKAEKRLKRAKKLLLEGAKFELEDTYIDIVSGDNRAITVYWNNIA